MKVLRIFSLVVMTLLCNTSVMHAMEARVEGRSFMGMTMVDIQSFAAVLSQETGETYRIVTMPELVERSLQMLGLDGNSTPLDIKYHYELFKQKLSKDNALYEAAGKAYNQLMRILFELGDYQEEIVKLELMNFAQVQVLELMHTQMKPQAFKKYKNKLIDDTISTLLEYRRQQFANKAIRVSSDIHTLLGLSVNEPFNSIQTHYNRYMEKNSPNKLIALRTTNQLSDQEFRDTMATVKEVEAAYARHLEEHHLQETPKRRATQ